MRDRSGSSLPSNSRSTFLNGLPSRATIPEIPSPGLTLTLFTISSLMPRAFLITISPDSSTSMIETLSEREILVTILKQDSNKVSRSRTEHKRRLASFKFNRSLTFIFSCSFIFSRSWTSLLFSNVRRCFSMAFSIATFISSMSMGFMR